MQESQTFSSGTTVANNGRSAWWVTALTVKDYVCNITASKLHMFDIISHTSLQTHQVILFMSTEATNVFLCLWLNLLPACSPNKPYFYPWTLKTSFHVTWRGRLLSEKQHCSRVQKLWLQARSRSSDLSCEQNLGGKKSLCFHSPGSQLLRATWGQRKQTRPRESRSGRSRHLISVSLTPVSMVWEVIWETGSNYWIVKLYHSLRCGELDFFKECLMFYTWVEYFI